MGNKEFGLDDGLPLLSIITINRNNFEGLNKTLETIFSQTWKNFESIVIDGASTDNSLKVIEKFSKNITYKSSEPDTGIYHAMNKGILRAKGRYLLFLNSGDFFFSKDTLERIFKRHPKAQVVYFDLLVDYGTRQELGKMPEKLSYELFVDHEIWHQALMAKSLFEKFGLYDESFRLLGDYEYWLRTIVRNNVTTQYMPVTIAVFNTFGAGSNPKNQPIVIAERKRAKKKNLTFWQYYWNFGLKYRFVTPVMIRVRKAGRYFMKIFHQN